MTALRWTLCLAVLLLPMKLAAADFCDESLPKESTSPMKYRMRGDRCEGIYAQQVSSISLEVRSLVAGFGPFDPAKDEMLDLAWAAPSGSIHDVHLRAFSFKPRTYYRMDTRLAAIRGVYHWPTDVLASVELAKDDLGLLAWIDRPGPGGSTDPLYLPLLAGPGASRSADGYEVTLFPSASLAEVRLTVSRLDEAGKVVAKLRQNEELGYGYYPSTQPIPFSTGKLGPEGVYRLAITAITKSGLSVEKSLELYHPGN